MTMVHFTELLSDEHGDHDVDLTLWMTVGAGAVDPRLIEPDHREPDVEELIAFRCSGL
jgi:hypothetical protein